MREINVTFLDKYEVLLRSRGSIAVRIKGLRTTFNLAICRDLIKQNLYPFHKYKISKLHDKRIKFAVTIKEIESFRNVDCEGDFELTDANIYFLFSFYTRGIDFAEIMRLRWSMTNKRIT